MDKRKRIFRIVKLFLLGFVVLYSFRLIYGYSDSSSKGNEEYEYISDFFDNMESGDMLKRNYASTRYSKSESKGKEISDAVSSAPLPQGSEQKFEKIASLKSKTAEFEKDEKNIRAYVKKFNSLIQYEHNEGNPGSRQLHLSIGVPPENFDVMLAELKKTGSIKSIQVTKTDKTNEYRNLNAQKASLEKTRNVLIELQNKDGKIDEYMSLSNRILEIEQQLQELGVSLGDFDTENEFCTVHMTIVEGKFIPISFMHRAKVALEWTINYYCLFTLILLFASGTAFFGVWVYDKIKN